MRVPGLGEVDLAKIVQTVRELALGGSAAIGGDVTIQPGTTQTVVNDPLCSPTSEVVIIPKTATARAALLYAVPENGRFTVHHGATSATDRTFTYEVRQP